MERPCPAGVVGNNGEVIPVVLHLPSPGGVIGSGAHYQKEWLSLSFHLIEHLDPGSERDKGHGVFSAARLFGGHQHFNLRDRAGGQILEGLGELIHADGRPISDAGLRLPPTAGGRSR